MKSKYVCLNCGKGMSLKSIREMEGRGFGLRHISCRGCGKNEIGERNSGVPAPAHGEKKKFTAFAGQATHVVCGAENHESAAAAAAGPLRDILDAAGVSDFPVDVMVRDDITGEEKVFAF